MSNSFLAGNRLRAERVAWQRLWSVSSTTATGLITSIAAILTAPSSTYTAGSAYMIQYGGLFSPTAALNVQLEIRDTNTAGTQRMGVRRYNAPSAVNWAYDGLWPVANTGAADITSRVLVLCGTASTSSFIVNAGTNLPYFFTCYYVGLATDYPEAVAL